MVTLVLCIKYGHTGIVYQIWSHWYCVSNMVTLVLCNVHQIWSHWYCVMCIKYGHTVIV